MCFIFLAYLRRGIAKKEQKQAKSAKLDFEAVLKFDPDNKKAKVCYYKLVC